LNRNDEMMDDKFLSSSLRWLMVPHQRNRVIRR